MNEHVDLYNNSVLTGATMQTEEKLLAVHVTVLLLIQEINLGIQELPLSGATSLWKRSYTDS